MPKDFAERESFTIISNDSLHAYENKFYQNRQYLDNCACKIERRLVV